MRYDVKSATIRSGGSRELAMERVGVSVILCAEGILEVILEGGARTGASGEGCIEMTQAVRVWKAVGFSGRIAKKAELRSNHVGGAMPFFEPAVGTCQGYGEP